MQLDQQLRAWLGLGLGLGLGSGLGLGIGLGSGLGLGLGLGWESRSCALASSARSLAHPSAFCPPYVGVGSARTPHRSLTTWLELGFA